MLLRTAAAAAVLRCVARGEKALRHAREERRAEAHESCHAPPATDLRHAEHLQMPTAVRRIAFLPQNTHMYCERRLARSCGRRGRRGRRGRANLGVLGDLNLLHDLTQRRTVAGGVLAADADLLGALSLRMECVRETERGRERERGRGEERRGEESAAVRGAHHERGEEES